MSGPSSSPASSTSIASRVHHGLRLPACNPPGCHLCNLRVGARGIEYFGRLAALGGRLRLGAALARRHEAAVARADWLLEREIAAAGPLLQEEQGKVNQIQVSARGSQCQLAQGAFRSHAVPAVLQCSTVKSARPKTHSWQASSCPACAPWAIHCCRRLRSRHQGRRWVGPPPSQRLSPAPRGLLHFRRPDPPQCAAFLGPVAKGK